MKSFLSLLLIFTGVISHADPLTCASPRSRYSLHLTSDQRRATVEIDGEVATEGTLVCRHIETYLIECSSTQTADSGYVVEIRTVPGTMKIRANVQINTYGGLVEVAKLACVYPAILQ